MNAKMDLKKELKALYAPGKLPAAVAVPALKAFAIDGEGDPNRSGLFQECVEALYAASYTLKFASKKSGRADWTVMPLEGEWWCPDMPAFSLERKEDWLWTLFIVQPDSVTQAEAAEAVSLARAKKKLAALDRLRFVRSEPCEAATAMHLGPYAAEGPAIRALHEFIAAEGWALAGKHREIYLSDPRSSAPGSMKTVLRQPFSRRV